MGKNSEILQHSQNEKVIKQMLASGCSTRDIANYYDCQLADVRKFIAEVIK